MPSCEDAQTAAFVAQASESWYVHEAGFTDSAHRISGRFTRTCNGSSETDPVYVINQGSAGVQEFFQSYLRSSADSWSYLFMDDTSASVLSQTYGPGGGFCAGQYNNWCETTQEYPTDASVLAAHESFIASLSHGSGAPVQAFFNGVGFSGSNPTNLDLISGGEGRFTGAVCENCIVNAGTLRPNMYANVLTAIAQTVEIPSAAFIELNTGYSAAGSSAQITQRMVSTAVLWLGFAPGQTIDFENLEDNTENLAVWPEEAVYPTQPLQSMSNSSSDIAVAPGVYRREFAACYLRSVPIGPCAAILNANTSALAVNSGWLQQTYGHQLSMAGGDIESGGSVQTSSTTFAPNSTQVGPGEAVLLTR